MVSLAVARCPGRYATETMIRFLALLYVITFVGCSSNRAPEELTVALRNSKSLVLYSLDPTQQDENTVPSFHNWAELGTTDVSTAILRTQLLNSLDAAIANSDGVAAACFDPRHGLRAKHNGKTYDVVICFQCYQAQWYIDGKQQPGFLLTGIAQKTFDAVLTEAGVELAPDVPATTELQ